MTVQQAYQAGLAILTDAKQPRFQQAGLLFEHVFGISRSRLPIVFSKPADEKKADEFLSLCRQLQAGTPLQYLLGHWGFYGLDFMVGPGVLIPQPDTEVLVETALELIKHSHLHCPVVYDLCSGSGCIAVTIGKQIPQSKVYALELSDQAFQYLKKNIKKNAAANVTPLHQNVLTPNGLPSADLILSNPPYIPTGDLAGLPSDVRQEPVMALDGGADGLSFYKEILRLYFNLLKPGGWLAVEIGYNQGTKVAQLFQNNHYCKIQMRKDFGGNNRVVFGQKPLET